MSQFGRTRAYEAVASRSSRRAARIIAIADAPNITAIARPMVICTLNPGFPEELFLRADRRTLIGWWRGDLARPQALRTGLVLEGRREWVRAFPSWFERYLFAAIAPTSARPVRLPDQSEGGLGDRIVTQVLDVPGMPTPMRRGPRAGVCLRP
jgi:hypothetical protein